MSTWVIGVDLGGTQIRAVRADRDGQLAARAKQLTHAREGPEPVISRMLQTIGEAMQGVDSAEVAGVGIGVPGPIDPSGALHDPPNLPGWGSISVTERLAEGLGIPVFAGNDANLAALGEHRFGAGRGVNDLVYLTVSTGIGGGIISGGRLITGAHGFAAELGHMTLVPDGPICGCGQPGHLEALASGPAIARDARAALEQGRESIILDEAGSLDTVSAASVSAAAAKGDALAIELMESAGFYIGLGLVNVIHILEPQRILIGGGVSEAGELLLKPMRDTIRQRLMSPIYQHVEVLPAALGADVGLMGAVALALTEINSP